MDHDIHGLEETEKEYNNKVENFCHYADYLAGQFTLALDNKVTINLYPNDDNTNDDFYDVIALISYDAPSHNNYMTAKYRFSAKSPAGNMVVISFTVTAHDDFTQDAFSTIIKNGTCIQWMTNCHIHHAGERHVEKFLIKHVQVNVHEKMPAYKNTLI